MVHHNIESQWIVPIWPAVVDVNNINCVCVVKVWCVSMCAMLTPLVSEILWKQ
jgi:hypothetical protein